MHHYPDWLDHHRQTLCQRKGHCWHLENDSDCYNFPHKYIEKCCRPGCYATRNVHPWVPKNPYKWPDIVCNSSTLNRIDTTVYN